MRQAYDYWQDQPGNYFPHRPTDGPTPVHGVPGDAFPDGSSSTTSVKTTFAHETSQDNPMVVTFGLSTYSSLSLKVGSLDPPLFPLVPRSHKSQERFPSSLSQTKITPFKEDYQRSAPSQRQRRPRRISEWLITSGLAIGKQSTSPLHRRRTLQNEHLRTFSGFIPNQAHPSQASFTLVTSSSLDSISQAHQPSPKKKGGVLNESHRPFFNLLMGPHEQTWLVTY